MPSRKKTKTEASYSGKSQFHAENKRDTLVDAGQIFYMLMCSENVMYCYCLVCWLQPPATSSGVYGRITPIGAVVHPKCSDGPLEEIGLLMMIKT